MKKIFIPKKKSVNAKKLFSSSILTGLFLVSTTTYYTNVANAQSYSAFNGNETYNDDLIASDNQGRGIEFTNSTGTFNKTVIASNNTITGIVFDINSNGTFNGNVTVNDNQVSGILFGSKSNGTFNADVTVNDNTQNGIAFFNSTGTFKGDVTANNNTVRGIFFNDNSNGTFNANVTTRNNVTGIQFGSNSTGIFNGDVTANDNTHGIIFFDNATGTFNANVTTSDNKFHGISFLDSKGTFKGAVVTNNNIANGISCVESKFIFEDSVKTNGNKQGVHLALNALSTFNSSVTANSNIEKGIFISHDSKGTFEDTVIASNNQGDGIAFDNSEGTFNANVTANNNAARGIAFINSTGNFNGDVIANNNSTGSGHYDSIYFSSSVGTFYGTVTANNNISAQGMYFLDNSTGTFNANVTTSNNSNNGFYFWNNSSGTFNADVITSSNQGNGGIFIISSGTFNADLTANKNISHGIAFIDNSTGIFEGTVTASNNQESGIIFANNSKGTFEGAVTANDNQESGIIFANNSTGTFEGAVTASNNKQNGIIFIDSTGTFNGDVTAQSLHLQGSNTTVTLGDGINFSVPVTSIANQGKLDFQGGVTIEKSIGSQASPLNEVSFSSNDSAKIVNLKSDIFAGEIFLGGSTFKPANNTTITSTNIATNNPVFDLGTDILKFSGKVVHDDLNGKITINTTFDGTNAGHIEMTKAGDSINLTNSKGLIFNITDAPMTPIPEQNEIRTVDMFVENAGTLTLLAVDNTTINNANAFVIWSFDPITGILSQQAVEQPEEVLQEVVTGDSNTQQNLQNILDNDPALTRDLINIAANQGGDAAAAAIERLTNSDAVALATSPISIAVQDATNVISDRATRAAHTSAPLQRIVVDQGNIIGVAAGDESYKYGAWASPFYGTARQQSNNNAPGYKLEYYGAVVGFDALINDKTALGIGFSVVRTDIKHKDLNQGDKTRADNYVFSFYGTYEITKEWFVQCVTSIGRSKIKNREIRTEFGQTNIASANYNATSWGTEILTGYNQTISDNFIVTPLFGFEFNRLNGVNYKETGTNTQNLAVRRKAVNKLEAIAGVRFSTSYLTSDGMTITPELHGDVRYEMLNQSLRINIQQDGVPGSALVPRTGKQGRAVMNLGLNVKASHDDKFKYSIGYDLRLAKKYVGHQGTLTLRVNF